MWRLIIIISLFYTPAIHSQLCSVDSGQSVVIMDIQESQDSEVSQETTPREIPIKGQPGQDIALSIIPDLTSFSSYFILNGKKLQLQRPLDRDANDLASMVIKIECMVLSTGNKHNVPVIIRVLDINDHSPKFLNTPYEVSIPELTPVGTTIFRGIKAEDPDNGVNGIVEYSVIPMSGNDSDGYPYFSINLPHQGFLTVNKSLDYEKTSTYYVMVVAKDRASDPALRRSSTSTLTVHVMDSDDLDPSFTYPGCNLIDNVCVNPEYIAEVKSDELTGVIDIYPSDIEAKDRDSLGSPIYYSFLKGTPDTYASYFEIDHETGQVRQTRAVNRTIARDFQIIVKAEERTEAHRYATAKLLIKVQALERSPPILEVNSMEGYVNENSPIGTLVTVDKDGKEPIKFKVHDPDLTEEDAIPSYRFELTSPAFRINSKMELTIGQTDIDRDPPNPNTLVFQVVAKETSGFDASEPVFLTVHLNDVNDNAPSLPLLNLATVSTSNSPEFLTQIIAKDNDEGDNAKVFYKLHHVSNNGQDKFKIDKDSGNVTMLAGVDPGLYSLTIQAIDNGGKFSQSILEVRVIPGPNQAGPVFSSQVYDAKVSEGADIKSAIVSLDANDADSDRVLYSIVEGNEAKHFEISPETGIITVAKKLDRESLSRYSLLVRAADEEGLASTATVLITVSDINDKNPEFINLPYNFEISEGQKDIVVGRVKAIDSDADENAEVHYSVPDASSFAVDPRSGEIRTRSPLDYEKQKIHYVVVTAMDGAADPRISTATVTVSVLDVPDEPPVFRRRTYKTTIPENRVGMEVATIQAEDPDTDKSITYVLKSGSDYFNIDPRSGLIRTSKELDYETETQHIVVVGTVENENQVPEASATVTVTVEDVNDLPPSFSALPRPTSVKDTLAIGAFVTSVTATDGDGTSPGNQVHYQVVGEGKAENYFYIDRDSGVITLKDNLKKESDTTYKISVKAYDLGSPSLSTTATVTVSVEHTINNTPDRGIGFADTQFSVEVPESVGKEFLVKTITIINKPAKNVPLSCEIISGNELNHFYLNQTEDRDCELRVGQELDYENVTRYTLGIKLNTLSGYMAKAKSEAMIQISVLDENDNKPEFVYDSIYSSVAGSNYVVAMPENSQISSYVIEVKATDSDSGPNGQLSYSIVPETNLEGFFEIDPVTGIIRNAKPLSGINSEDLPFNLTVRCTDNAPVENKRLTVDTNLLVNVIEDKSRFILVIPDAVPETVLKSRFKLIKTLQDQTEYLVGIEKIESRHFVGPNNTMQLDKNGTDVWLYFIDPINFRISERNDTQVTKKIVDPSVQSNLLYYLSGNLGAAASEIRGPLDVSPTVTARPVKTYSDIDGIQAALIALACIIVFLGIIGIIYICFLWSRYIAQKEKSKRMYVMPRYEPVVAEPTSLKEYETQVLQMSVPFDEVESLNDFQMDFSPRNHTLSLDKVGYITRDHGTLDINESGHSSPSDVTQTRTLSFKSQKANSPNSFSSRPAYRFPSDNSEDEIIPPESERLPRHLLVLQESGVLSHKGSIFSPEKIDKSLMTVSKANENVLFKDKNEYNDFKVYPYMSDYSPIETTTEL